MHTLEPEYMEFNADGVIDESATMRAVALDRGSIFSLYTELRFALYVSVAAITTGIGILLKNNLDHIGSVTLIVALAFIATACYANAARVKLRGEARSIGGDYVLLLGALIIERRLGLCRIAVSLARYILVMAFADTCRATRDNCLCIQ
jgi:hypothetical protein